MKTSTWDVVAWNRAAAAVLVDYGTLDPKQRNLLRLVFLDPHIRVKQRNKDRKAALKELREAERNLAIARAEESLWEAWNYNLLNSLYLDADLSHAAANFFVPLRKIVAYANFPDPGSGVDTSKLKAEASELLEQLLQRFRAGLRVADDDQPAA